MRRGIVQCGIEGEHPRKRGRLCPPVEGERNRGQECGSPGCQFPPFNTTTSDAGEDCGGARTYRTLDYTYDFQDPWRGVYQTFVIDGFGGMDTGITNGSSVAFGDEIACKAKYTQQGSLSTVTKPPRNLQASWVSTRSDSPETTYEISECIELGQMNGVNPYAVGRLFSWLKAGPCDVGGRGGLIEFRGYPLYRAVAPWKIDVELVGNSGCLVAISMRRWQGNAWGVVVGTDKAVATPTNCNAVDISGTYRINPPTGFNGVEIMAVLTIFRQGNGNIGPGDFAIKGITVV